MASATCWFCGRGPSGEHARAFPFFSQIDDETRFVVVPRCDECYAFHTRKQMPSNYMVIGIAVMTLVVAALLPIPPGWRTAVNVVAMIGGLAAGIVFTSGHERREAARRGTRPAHDYAEHATYKAFFEDHARWRAHRDPTAHKNASSVVRRETVGDYRLMYADDPRGLAALDRACADSEAPNPERV